MAYSIKIETEALDDIQKGIRWYNKQQKGLGKKFHTAIKKSIDSLRENPFYQLRYDNIHCLPIKRYPYMVHFTINEEKYLIIVRAVFNTSINPEIWRNRIR